MEAGSASGTPHPRWILLPLLLMAACVVVTENVTHEERGAGYPGYKIEYVSAVAEPGTLLTSGTPVRFEVTVRYTLQAAETGRIVLTFRSERDVDLVPTSEVAQAIQRGRTETATLSQELMIPPGIRELTVRIPVVPEGIRSPVGALRLRYPVASAR